MREVYDECLRVAARCVRNRADAADLVHAVFLQAIERGVAELSATERRAWLRGALRRRALFDARVAGRRRRREHRYMEVRGVIDPAATPWRFSPDFLAQLQPSVRALAALASADLNPDEIRAVLRLSGTAFRKRLSMLRRFVRAASEAGLNIVAVRSTVYAFGPARPSVIETLRKRPEAVLGTHDPDGHPLIFAVRAPKSTST